MSAQIQITFLGTGASWPTAERGLSAIAVKRGAEVLLWDCGEGTQRQIQRSGVSYQAVTQIWLTHYHGDHCFGVPGLLKTMALNERDRPLAIYGPKGLLRMADAWRRMGGWTQQFPIELQEVVPGDRIRRDGYTVEVHEGDHSVHNIVLALQEDDRAGRFDKPKALGLGVPEGPLFGRLQRGQDVEVPGVGLVRSADVVGPARRGRRIAFSGDSQPCLGLLEAARDADVFICEATFTQDMVERAREVRHMTAAEAGAVAAKARARQLILTHISPRFKDPEPVLAEARAVHPGTSIAHDLMVHEVPLP